MTAAHSHPPDASPLGLPVDYLVDDEEVVRDAPAWLLLRMSPGP